MFLDIICMDRWYKVGGNILSICNTQKNAHMQLRLAVFDYSGGAGEAAEQPVTFVHNSDFNERWR